MSSLASIHRPDVLGNVGDRVVQRRCGCAVTELPDGFLAIVVDPLRDQAWLAVTGPHRTRDDAEQRLDVSCPHRHRRPPQKARR